MKLEESERGYKNILVDRDNILGKNRFVESSVLLIRPSGATGPFSRKELKADSLTYNLAKLFELTSE